MINYYVVLTKKSGGHTFIQLETKSLEETDQYIANNFSSYHELKKYIMANGDNQGTTYNPYPFIKKVIKSSKGQETEHISPVYAIIDQKRILEECKKAIKNQNIDPNYYRFHRKEMREILEIFNKEKITYEDIRKCYFHLIQLEIPKKDLEIHDVKKHKNR